LDAAGDLRRRLERSQPLQAVADDWDRLGGTRRELLGSLRRAECAELRTHTGADLVGPREMVRPARAVGAAAPGGQRTLAHTPGDELSRTGDARVEGLVVWPCEVGVVRIGLVTDRLALAISAAAQPTLRIPYLPKLVFAIGAPSGAPPHRLPGGTLLGAGHTGHLRPLSVMAHERKKGET